MRRAIGRASMVSVAAALIASGFGIGIARAACYPGPCNGADAKLTGIFAPPVEFTNAKWIAGVGGKNVGNKPSQVVTTLTTNNGSTSPWLGDNVRVPAGGRYSAYFFHTPSHVGGAKLTGCTAAVPHDANPSNNCGTIHTRVLRGF